MDKQAYIDEIKLKLGGDLLDLEIEDESIGKIVDSAMRELQRYGCSTKLATIPYAGCIDLTDCNISSVVRVFRTVGYMGESPQNSTLMADPAYMAQWQILGGNGNLYNLSDWVLNYGAWNTMLQIRNTTSTDLIFRYDKSTNRLYINIASDRPDYITIEYIPKWTNVEDITSDYWIDMLMRLSLAIAKVTIGRIRTKFTQSNAPYSLDGDKILEEGNTELTELRTYLQANTQLCYGID